MMADPEFYEKRKQAIRAGQRRGGAAGALAAEKAFNRATGFGPQPKEERNACQILREDYSRGQVVVKVDILGYKNVPISRENALRIFGCKTEIKYTECETCGNKIPIQKGVSAMRVIECSGCM